MVRDPATKHAMFVRTAGQVAFLKGATAASGWGGVNLIAAPGDVDEDGTADVIARNSADEVRLYRGATDGKVVSSGRSYARFSGLDQLTGVGDFDDDGHVDLVGRVGSSDDLMLYPGHGDGTFGIGPAAVGQLGRLRPDRRSRRPRRRRQPRPGGTRRVARSTWSRAPGTASAAAWPCRARGRAST